MLFSKGLLPLVLYLAPLLVAEIYDGGCTKRKEGPQILDVLRIGNGGAGLTGLIKGMCLNLS